MAMSFRHGWMGEEYVGRVESEEPLDGHALKCAFDEIDEVMRSGVRDPESPWNVLIDDLKFARTYLLRKPGMWFYCRAYTSAAHQCPQWRRQVPWEAHHELPVG